MRGDGKTTKQMQDAPKGALYLWCNGVLSYPMALARHLGREDLVIRSPSFLESGWQGARFPAVVVDHATSIHGNKIEALMQLERRSKLHAEGDRT